jgi:D-sedoheptulose 7-phosphate isomerase
MKMNSLIIKEQFLTHNQVSEDTLTSCSKLIEKAATMCIECLNNGNKILIFGNGGSAADAQHIAAEIVGRYKANRKGLPAIALTTDTSIITSISNDFGFQHLFDRQVQALAKKGDVLIGISTGGTSRNVLNALNLSENIGCQTIGLSGKGGGDFNNICDVNIIAASRDTPRIQEMHILVGHIICELIDQNFSGSF